MAAQGKSRANQNKAIRQEALREQLAAQGHVQHVVDLLEEVQCLSGDELNALELQKNKLVIDTKLALIKKYLPDTKQIELTSDDEDGIKVQSKMLIEVVRATAKDSDT